MPDNNDDTPTTDTAEDPTDDVTDAPGDVKNSSVDEPVEEPLADDGDGAERHGLGAWDRCARNRRIAGQLIFHHRVRDIVAPADGDAAMRVIGWFCREELIPVADFLAARNANAGHGWTAMDLTEVVGVTWVPGTLAGGERIVFDPVVADRA